MKINHNRDNVSSSPQREKVPVAAATKPKIFFSSPPSHRDPELINQNGFSVQYLKDKENGKVPFSFSSLLDAYVSNINVFICAFCCTGKHNKQQMNHFHTEPQPCSSLILSCSEPGTSGPF